MEDITNIKYVICRPNGSIERYGCIKKHFHGAFFRIKYLISIYGNLIKFDCMKAKKVYRIFCIENDGRLRLANGTEFPTEGEAESLAASINTDYDLVVLPVICNDK